MTSKTTKSPRVGGWWDRITPAITLVGALLTTVGFVLAFTLAGPVNGAAIDGVEVIGGQMVANQLLFSQKIFYFHVPTAIASFVALTVTAYYCVRFLMTRDAGYDLRAKVATEVALVFVIAVMATGEMWTRFEWGVWWTWEPRLTTYLILMLLVIAYFVLRASIDDPERRAVFASVFGLIMFADVPVCFMITRLIPSSVHPVIFRTDSGLSPDMLVPFLLALFGMLFVTYGLFRLRVRAAELDARAERIKEQLDD